MTFCCYSSEDANDSLVRTAAAAESHREEPIIHIELVGQKTESEVGSDLQCTGLALWHGSRSICDFMWRRGDDLHGRHILELGCGLGLAGIFASKLTGPAGSVTLTDYDDEVLGLCLRNVENNRQDSDSPTLVQRFSFGDSEEEQMLMSSTNSLAQGKFSMIIAADVIYESSGWQVDLLFHSVSRVLQGDGEFVLAYTRRLVPEEAIFAAAKKYGYEVKVDEESCFDMFGNNTDGLSDFWQHCIFVFTQGSDDGGEVQN
mmetsp:Transcript_45389/g.71010  ORF Transcript_45389/g.71010 Transcript_45389/m.71010 type:complete len:259 (-) Transcript_45389:339-1115(-)